MCRKVLNWRTQVFLRVVGRCVAEETIAVETFGVALRGRDKPLVIASGTPTVPGRASTEDDPTPQLFRLAPEQAAPARWPPLSLIRATHSSRLGGSHRVTTVGAGLCQSWVMTPSPILRRVSAEPGQPAPSGEWFMSVPAAAQLLREGWELSPMTVLVGENGAGKSTLMEAIGVAFGMGAEGGSTGARHATRPTESALWRHLVLVRDAGEPRRGFFPVGLVRCAQASAVICVPAWPSSSETDSLSEPTSQLSPAAIVIAAAGRKQRRR